MTTAMRRNQPSAAPAAACARLQYSSGHTKAKVNSPIPQPIVGFHVEQGIDPDFDDVLAGVGVSEIDLVHPRPAPQKPELKRHWFLGERVRFHPITSGPQYVTIGQLVKAAEDTAEAGIGISWPDGGKSKLALRGFLVIDKAPPLFCQFSVTSTMTDYLLIALVDHLRVCEAADKLVDRGRHPDLVMPHELGLMLGPGEPVAAGRNETTQIVPMVSLHPQEVTREYVTSVWARGALAAQAAERWEEVVAWARGYDKGPA